MASLPTGEELLRLISSLPSTALPSSSSSSPSLLAQSQLLLWNALFSSLQGAAVSLPQSDLEEGEIPKPKNFSPSSECKSRRPPVTDEKVVRIPLSHGWKRHTFIREMTAFGIKGVVVYFSPCQKRLGSFSEVIRYLGKHETGIVNREQFTFSPKVIVGEFFVGVPKNGQLVNVKFTEEDVKTELKRLQDERTKKMGEEKEKREEKRKEMMKKEREDKLKEKKEEGGMEEKEEGGEGKRRAVEDLTLEEIRPLPPFKRINRMELGGEAFGNILMTVQFMENFQKTLELEIIPSIEDLCRGCMGDCSSLLLPTLSSLLSRCLTHLPSTRRYSLHGKTLAQIPLTDTNWDELLRLLLSLSDGEGPELASALSSSSSFLSLSPDQKAAVMGTIVNQLVCSSAVRSQLDGHQEEVTKLKGERWMKEGKMRALRNHLTRRRKKRNGEEEMEMDHPPPSPERSIKFTPGIGQCEVLTPEEEALDDDEIDGVMNELGVKSDDLSSSINALNSRVRVFPIGEDRYHRLYWALPSDLPTLIESIESGHTQNPACDLTICERDPPSIQSDSFVDPEVIGCLEDTIDRLVEGGGEGKRRKQGLRMMGNSEKRGWWTVTSKDVDQWKANLHQRGLRERVLHRSITRNDLIDDLPLGEISIGPIGNRVNGEAEDLRRRKELNKKLIDLEYLLMEERIMEGEVDEDSEVSIQSLKRKILSIQNSIPEDRFNFEIEEDDGKEEEKREEKVNLLEEWKSMTERSSTTAQLGLATQLLCSFLSLSSSWQCSACLFPSSSSSFLLCSSCSVSRIHPSCTIRSQPFICLQCQPKISLIDEEDDQIIDVNDEDRKCGLPSKGGVKRRAEPNSFVVPPSMVNGLGRSILDELQELEGCEFFASPVDLDEVPSYSLLIDKPMDLGTISEKVERGGYSDADDLFADVSLVFSNCKSFNEDDSEIGEAGIRISRFFAKRWRQLKYNLSKRVKRMKIDS
ncbi:hypothetical protein PMAYCL1PPCAC_12317 [Pristionchus mayeri]|uniref:Baz-2 n=1 Tax=Pristionchus mayeri TaxID=1317129 RepID=A0AAN5CFQ5_9BILA|nr:hypothetical protein PMAYCL1PPCAC_12317 [Pristionchus mayeri]